MCKPTTTKRNQTRRSSMDVRFEQDPTRFLCVHPVPNRNDYSREEASDTWYTSEELSELRSECRKLIDEFVATWARTSEHKEDEDAPSIPFFCPGELPEPESTRFDSEEDRTPSYLEEKSWSILRGLECRTAMGTLRRRRHRIQGWRSVLLQQYKTKLNCSSNQQYPNATAIAEAYTEVTEPCRTAAHIMGLLDAQEVYPYTDVHQEETFEHYVYQEKEEEDCHGASDGFEPIGKKCECETPGPQTNGNLDDAYPDCFTAAMMEGYLSFVESFNMAAKTVLGIQEMQDWEPSMTPTLENPTSTHSVCEDEPKHLVENNFSDEVKQQEVDLHSKLVLKRHFGKMHLGVPYPLDSSVPYPLESSPKPFIATAVTA